MAYAPLWTAADMELIDPSISCITNAFVEASHKVTKEEIFDGKTNGSCADRCRNLEVHKQKIQGIFQINIKELRNENF